MKAYPYDLKLTDQLERELIEQESGSVYGRDERPGALFWETLGIAAFIIGATLLIATVG